MCSRVLVRAARECHAHPEIAAKLVHVGRDGKGLDIDGDAPGCLDLDVRLAGLKAERGVRGVGPVKGLPDRLAAEVNAKPRAIDFGLAAGMIMNLKDHVRPSWQRPADAVWQMHGHVSGRPAAEVSLDLHAGSGVRRIARSRFGGVALLTGSRCVEEPHHVMSDPTITRPILDRRDIDVSA